MKSLRKLSIALLLAITMVLSIIPFISYAIEPVIDQEIYSTLYYVQSAETTTAYCSITCLEDDETITAITYSNPDHYTVAASLSYEYCHLETPTMAFKFFNFNDTTDKICVDDAYIFTFGYSVQDSDGNTRTIYVKFHFSIEDWTHLELAEEVGVQPAALEDLYYTGAPITGFDGATTLNGEPCTNIVCRYDKVGISGASTFEAIEPGSYTATLELFSEHYYYLDHIVSFSIYNIDDITLSKEIVSYSYHPNNPAVLAVNGYEEGQYYVKYVNNRSVGTATAIVYDASTDEIIAAKPYTITESIDLDAHIYVKSSKFVYDGKSFCPEIQVCANGEIVPKEEYTVTYLNNSDAGDATIFVTDNEGGNFIVYGSTTFTIGSTDPSNVDVTLEFSSAAYTGTPLTPSVVVKCGDTIIPASEYTVTYNNNTNAGVASVVVTDNPGGNYTVNGTATFTIDPKAVLEITVELSEMAFQYDGTAHTPSVIVKDGDIIIPESEYTVEYVNNVNAGMGRVVITDVEGGNYDNISGSAMFGIAKLQSKVTTAPTAKTDLQENGTALELITAGVAEGGTIQYSVNGGEYSDAIPTATDAGTYTIKYKVVAAENYKDSEEAELTVTVAEKPAEPVDDPTTDPTEETPTEEEGLSTAALIAIIAGSGVVVGAGIIAAILAKKKKIK